MLTLWRTAAGDTGRVVRATRGRIVIGLEKVMDVRVPVRDVFTACGRIDRLPEVLPHVRDARPVAGDHHHWTVEDGASPPLEWDTVVTRFGTNRVLAWETVPGSVLRHAGHLTFRPNADGSTRVGVGLSFVLPPGAFGERIASLMTGTSLEDALRRWRTALETTTSSDHPSAPRT